LAQLSISSDGLALAFDEGVSHSSKFAYVKIKNSDNRREE